MSTTPDLTDPVDPETPDDVTDPPYVAWSAARGFYYDADGAYVRRRDFTRLVEAHARSEATAKDLARQAVRAEDEGGATARACDTVTREVERLQSQIEGLSNALRATMAERDAARTALERAVAAQDDTNVRLGRIAETLEQVLTVERDTAAKIEPALRLVRS